MTEWTPKQPGSVLTAMRPDIWARGLRLAGNLTGYEYRDKLPLPDGTIYACGGMGYSYRYNDPPKPVKTPEQIRRERTEEIDREISEIDGEISKKEDIAELRRRRAELEKEKAGLVSAPYVCVPGGGMEWLLHEVGHWVASTQEERLRPNYGYDSMFAGDGEHGDIREWQAWAFEEIVLAPYGPARSLAAPTCRDGVGFTKNQIPSLAFRHIETNLRQQGIDVDEWRSVYGEWFKWGTSMGHDAPWRAD